MVRGNWSCLFFFRLEPQSGVNEEEAINLEEIREFAKNFKIRRLSLGLTQTQVGQALTATEGPAYSQSAICRWLLYPFLYFFSGLLSHLGLHGTDFSISPPASFIRPPVLSFCLQNLTWVCLLPTVFLPLCLLNLSHVFAFPDPNWSNCIHFLSWRTCIWNTKTAKYQLNGPVLFLINPHIHFQCLSAFFPLVWRFEKLDITPKSAQKLKPVLERWLAEAELWNQKGQQNLMEFVGGEPSKKRKRRTSFTPQAIEVLNTYFEKNSLPTGQEITEIAKELNYDREVVRVWFCNRRQTLKNTSKINAFQAQ